MRRVLALVVLWGFAVAQTGDSFLQQLLGQLTDITRVLSVLKDRLEFIQQGLLSLVPAVALLALLYGATGTTIMSRLGGIIEPSDPPAQMVPMASFRS